MVTMLGDRFAEIALPVAVLLATGSPAGAVRALGLGAFAFLATGSGTVLFPFLVIGAVVRSGCPTVVARGRTRSRSGSSCSLPGHR